MGEEELTNEGNEPEVRPTIENPSIAPSSGRVLIEAQLNALQEALTRRMNPTFDPMMMALSAGFLKPTKTGGFGESLGYALEGAAGAQEQERSRKAELEKLKLDLSLKQYDLARKDQARALLQKYAGSGPQTTLSQDATQPTGEATQAPKTVDVTPEQAVKVVSKMPDAIYKMTMNDGIVAALTALDPETGKLAKQIWDMQKGMVEIGQKERELGFKEKEVGQKEFDTVERPHPLDPGATIRLSRKDIPDYDKVLATNNPIEVSKFLARKGTPGYFGKTFDAEPAEGFKQPPTQSEREIEKLRKEEDIKADAEIDKTARESMFLTQKKATDVMIPEATQILKFAKDKSGKNAFGYLAGRGLLPAVVNALSEGFSIGNYKIGIPELRNTLKLADPNFTEEDLKAAQAITQNLTRLELAVAEARKEGAVTNFERTLFASLAPLRTDTPQVAAFKSELIINRGIMDDLTAKTYIQWKEKNKGKYVSDFRNSKEYNNLRRHYNNQIDKIRKNYGFDVVPPLSSIPENEQL